LPLVGWANIRVEEEWLVVAAATARVLMRQWLDPPLTFQAKLKFRELAF